MSKGSTKPINKLAFYITGPESAGNRLMARSFHTAGVTSAYVAGKDFYKPAPHTVRYEDDPLLVSMSIPYNFVWPDISRIYLDIRYDSDYNEIRQRVVWIILDRDTDAMAQSQLRQKRVRWSEQSYRNIKRARAELDIAVEFLKHIKPEIVRVQYENFVTDSKYRRNLFRGFGLPEPTIEYFNANERYE